MDFLLLLVLVVILILILSIRNNVAAQLRTLDVRISDLTRLLGELRQQEKRTDQPAEPEGHARPTIEHAATTPIRKAPEPEKTIAKEEPVLPERAEVGQPAPVRAVLPVIEPGKVVAIEDPAKSAETTLFTPRWFIWIALGAVMVVLGLMSIKMAREARGRQS